MRELLPVRPCSRLAPYLVRWRTAVVMLVFTISISGCTERTVLSMRHGFDKVDKIAARQIKRAQSANAVRVWFIKERSGSLHLVPVTRNVAGSDKLRECIGELLYGPTGQEARSGLASEIPPGTVLIDVTQHDGDLVLNLSRRFAAGGEDSFATRLEQLRRTVAGIAGNRRVFLDVEGKRLTEAGGEGLEVKQPINM